MKEFCFLDYCTVYSCHGSINKRMSAGACFATVFNNINDESKNTYKILLYKGTGYAADCHKSNACLFTKEEIRRHLLLLKSFYPFHYKVRDYKINDGKPYGRIEVSIQLSNVPAIFHKYLLTWLRYTYEYPYNVILKDAYALKKDPMFRFESIANLFNLILGCFCEDPRDIHQIPYNCVSTLMTIADVKKRIQEAKKLNSIYKEIKPKEYLLPRKIGNYTIEDIEYWENKFQVRKPIYINAYKSIKR